MDVRGLALKLTGDLPHKDFTGEARRLFQFVRDEIRYVKDIQGVETLHPAAWVIRLAAGDCDDKAILLAALLLSLGHTPRFKAVAFAPEDYSHVWTQDFLGDEWVDMEPTELYPLGKAVPLAGAADLLTMDI